jgi:hypothetical protein
MTRPPGIPSTHDPHPTVDAGIRPWTDDDFDQQLARCHRGAVSQLSARTQAQLQQRLHALVSPRRHARRRDGRAWGLAAAGALVVVAALGARWQALRGSAAAPRAAIVSATPGGNAMPDNGAVLASLDQPPDLYLWLASDDARAMLAE